MNNFFVGLNNLSDDEIRGQIALLKCVTFSNTIKEHGQRAVKYFVEAASGMFGMGQSDNEDVIELLNIRKLIDRTYNDLSEEDRESLDSELKQELINKAALVSGRNISQDISEDALYVLVVREAAKVYAIDVNMTPADMADEIHNQYYEHYLRVMQKKVMNLSQEEKATLEMLFQRAIPKSDIHVMRQLANELMLREFNGKTILTKLVVSKSTSNLRKVIDAMGLGVFDGIDGVLNTAYDSMMMFCRIERAILAQCVWTAVNGYGKRTGLKDDLMPSFDANLANVNQEKERKLLLMIAKEKQLNNEMKDLLKEISRLEKGLYSKEKSRDDEKEKIEQAQSEYRQLLEENEKINEQSDSIKSAYEEYINNNSIRNSSDPEYRRRKQDYEEHARKVRNIEYRIEASEKNIFRISENLERIHIQIDDINKRMGELREDLVERVSEFNRLVMELENEACYLARVLERKWNAFFVTLQFQQFVYENVIKRFTQREIVAIERLLTELDQSETKNSFAHRQEKDIYVTSCVVATGKYAIVSYDDNKIIDISVKGKN